MVIKIQKNDALEVYIAEYNNVWQEILKRVDTQNQILSMQLGVIAISVSGVTFFHAQPILYLLGALLLGLLSWIMMEQTARINNMMTFIRTVLATKIEAELPDSVHPVLAWPLWVDTVNAKNFLFQILSIIKFVVGPFIVVLFCVFFAVEKQSLGIAWSSNETILFIGVVIVLAIPMLIGSISALITHRLSKKTAGQTRLSKTKPNINQT